MLSQESCQTTVARMCEPSSRQPIELRGKPPGGDPPTVRGNHALLITIAGGQSLLQQSLQRQGKPRLAALSHFQQFAAAVQQMRVALLVNRSREPIVNAPAVMHHPARPIKPQQPLSR